MSELNGSLYGLGRTHEPLLAAVLAIAGPGAVLEMGAGYGSTPLLHAICAATARPLLTVDSNMEWIETFASLRSVSHRLVHLDSWDKLYNIAEERMAVALIDHAPAERRIVDIENLANRCEFLVIHDTEHSLYGYDPVLSKFKYRTDYKRMVPWTSVISNSRHFPSSV